MVVGVAIGVPQGVARRRKNAKNQTATMLRGRLALLLLSTCCTAAVCPVSGSVTPTTARDGEDLGSSTAVAQATRFGP